MTPDLDAQVRAADPDRWLSSRFVADAQARADLIALYAFEAELTAIPTRVSQPMLAEMRFVWWAEQMDGVFAGAPRKGHPVLEALARSVGRRGLRRPVVDALIEASIRQAHGEPPDLDALYVHPMQEAARLLDRDAKVEAVAPAGRMLGLARTGREEEARAQRPTANTALGALSHHAFPAVAAATLWRRDEPQALRRLRLVWAVATGRV